MPGYPLCQLANMQARSVWRRPRCLWQVTEGTVDEGVFGLAKQKLLLDAAVLQGITAGDQANNSGRDVAQMGQLLQALVTGTQPDMNSNA